jgi:hypothetical protein
MRTYTNLVVEELDVLDSLMEHRSCVRLHARTPMFNHQLFYHEKIRCVFFSKKVAE